jgi:uncharacterized protein (TIGR04255 family)
MGKKMENPPIFYTVGQIVFNPVLNMGEYVPKFHARIRKDFPEVRDENVRQFQLNLAEKSNDGLTSSSAPRWSFTSLKQTGGYILRRDSIAFHTTAYETSEHFIGELLRGISLVNELVGLSYIDRVGFRTLDAVVAEPEKPLGFFLRQEVLGFQNFLSGEMKHNMSENVTALPNAQLVSRVVILSGQLGVPIDLYPILLQIKPRLQTPLGVHAIIDLDHSQQDRFEYELDEIGERVRLGKAAITEVFRKVVTREALEYWS